MKKEKDIFDKKKLQSIVDDLCSHFKDYDDYSERGLGVVAVHNGEIVSGASSYTVYKYESKNI